MRSFYLIALTMLTFNTERSNGASIDLDFSNPTIAPSANHLLNLGFGDTLTGSFSYNFDTVAVGPNGELVDAKVDIAVIGGYDNVELYPDYNSTTAAEPNDDLGFLHWAYETGFGGVDYTISLFEGGTNYATPYIASQLEILVYDVDGEAQNGTVVQSETLTTYFADGLIAYQTGTNANSLTPQVVSGGVTFEGPGENYSETDATGAVILTYENTDSLTLSFRSQTDFLADLSAYGIPEPVNPVFSAIDGNLSMNTNDFGDPVLVPEPSILGLSLLAGSFLLMGQRKRV